MSEEKKLENLETEDAEPKKDTVMNEEKNLDDFELDDEEMDSVSGGSQECPRRVTFQCNYCSRSVSLQYDGCSRQYVNCTFCGKKYHVEMTAGIIRSTRDRMGVSNVKWEY